MLAVVVVAAAIAGCTDDDSKSGRDKSANTTTTKPKSSTTADPDEAIKREIVDAYDRWQNADRKISENPDPGSPLLDELYADPLKAQAIQHFADNQARGIHSPPRPGDVSKWGVLDIEIRSASEVVVHVCYVDGSWTLDSSSEVVDGRIGTYDVNLRFVEGGGNAWRAAEIVEQSRLEGIAGCAEQLP